MYLLLMSLTINNKKIISFFEQRPEIDIETMLLKFIDIMENLQETMNKTLNNSSVMEILDNIKSLRNDNQKIVTTSMIDIKRGLNEDIRMIMNNAMNEKLEPTLREKLKEQQASLVAHVYTRLENVLENKIMGLKQTTNANREIISSQNETLNSLLKRFENSSKKGKISENILNNVLAEVYPLAEIQDVGKTKETGDIMFLRKSKPTILIENKEWTRPIVNQEIVKFERDVEIQKTHGLFLSQNTGICSKDNYEVNLIN